MTSIFNIFSSLEDSINKITGKDDKKHNNDFTREYNRTQDNLQHTSLSQGAKFNQYQNKIFERNRYNMYKVNTREGFGGQQNSSSSSSQSSQQILNETAISPQQNTNIQSTYQQYDGLMGQYQNIMTSIDGSANSYLSRVSNTNPYLNKIITFTGGQVFYVTNQGIARPIPSWDIYYSTGAPQQLVNNIINLTIAAPANVSTPGTPIPTSPPLVSGTPLVENQSVGHEGETVYVNRMISNPSPSYLGCYADNPEQSLMTFIGSAPNSGVVITNGNFSQPAIASNSYNIYNDSTSVPGWTFTNAFLINNSSAWGYSTPYPDGNQAVCFQTLQNASISQSLNMGIGTYYLSFWACGRNCCDGSGLANPIDVQLNGTTVETITPSPINQWISYDVSLNVTTSGTNTITFQGANETYDRSTAIQGVILSSESNDSSGNYTLQDCQEAAIAGGYQYFGLQNANYSTGLGYCAVSNNQVSATSLGAATAPTSVVTLWSSNTSGNPGAYATLNNTGALVVYNTSGTIIYSTDASGANPSNYYGCYGDSSTRAMPTVLNGGSVTYTYSDCMQQAQDQGQPYFGLQNVQSNGQGQCFLSSDIDQSREYGIATNCTSVNGNTYGGGWSNAVYSVNPGAVFFLILQSDGNLCVYRGQGPNDNQGEIWSSSTNGQLQAANPVYQASNSIYGNSYITTGQTLAAGDFIGTSNGNGYLLMQTDGNLVLYTSQMGSNCSTLPSSSASAPSSKAASKAASITQMGGGQYATGLYQLSAVGVPGDMGQIGYVDGDSNLYTFPTTNITLTNRYTKLSGMDNSGADYLDASGTNVWYGTNISGTAATVEDCVNTCNSYSDCYGFSFSNGTCYPKTSSMSYSGNSQNLNVDLYTRNKGVTNPPLGVPTKTSSISTNEWANYASGGDIGSSYGLNAAVSGQQQQMQSWQSQMDSVSDNILQMAGQFSNSDSLVQSKATQNTQQLLKDKKELTQLKKKIGNMREKVIPNFEQIVDDTNIRVLQANYSYMFWSILAIAVVLITVNMSKRQ